MVQAYGADLDQALWVPGLPFGAPPSPPPTGAKADIIAAAGLNNPGVLTSTGSYTASTNSEVVENLDVDGGIINVKANDVIVRNCRVRGFSNVNVIRLHPGYGGLLIEDCEVIALPNPSDPSKGPTGAIGGNGASHITVRRCDISGFADGIKAEPYSLYEANYIHMYKPSGASKHLDGIQGSGDSHVTIRGNVIDADINKGGNAAVLTQGWNGSNCVHVTNNVVEGNYLYGGNYTVYFNGGKAVCGQPDGYWLTDHYLLDNVFEGGFRYGHFRTHNTGETTISGNVDALGNPLEF